MSRYCVLMTLICGVAAAGCARHDQDMIDLASDPALTESDDGPALEPQGFFPGVFHGYASPVLLVASWFDYRNVYSVPNDGLAYDIGYLLGVIGMIASFLGFGYFGEHDKPVGLAVVTVIGLSLLATAVWGVRPRQPAMDSPTLYQIYTAARDFQRATERIGEDYEREVARIEDEMIANEAMWRAGINPDSPEGRAFFASTRLKHDVEDSRVTFERIHEEASQPTSDSINDFRDFPRLVGVFDGLSAPISIGVRASRGTDTWEAKYYHYPNRGWAYDTLFVVGVFIAGFVCLCIIVIVAAGVFLPIRFLFVGTAQGGTPAGVAGN